MQTNKLNERCLHVKLYLEQIMHIFFLPSNLNKIRDADFYQASSFTLLVEWSDVSRHTHAHILYIAY